jgi:hypothetical protein
MHKSALQIYYPACYTKALIKIPKGPVASKYYIDDVKKKQQCPIQPSLVHTGANYSSLS